MNVPAAVGDGVARLMRYEALRCAVTGDSRESPQNEVAAFMRAGMATWLVNRGTAAAEQRGAPTTGRFAEPLATSTEFVGVLTDMALAVATARREALS